MLKISIRVYSEAARFDVAVLADSVKQAVSLVRDRYHTSDVRLRPSTGPIGFPVDGLPHRTRTDGLFRQDALAA